MNLLRREGKHKVGYNSYIIRTKELPTAIEDENGDWAVFPTKKESEKAAIKHLYEKQFTKPNSKKSKKEKVLDYSLKNEQKVWFTYIDKPRFEGDWLEAEIIDLNWATKSAAIQVKGYLKVTCVSLNSISRERYYVNN